MFVNTSDSSVGGVMVSIDAFQALDPGSIPGHRTFFLCILFIPYLSYKTYTDKPYIESWF